MLDHALAHPWEVPLAVFQIFGGGIGVVASLSDQITVSPTVDNLPWFLALAMCLMLAVGGVMTLFGIFDDGDDMMRGWRLERSGLILAATGWTVYTGILLATHPESLLGWAFGLVATVSAGLRTWATFREERRLRNATGADE